MTETTTRDVLAEAVEIRGGVAGLSERYGHMYGSEHDSYYGAGVGVYYCKLETQVYYRERGAANGIEGRHAGQYRVMLKTHANFGPLREVMRDSAAFGEHYPVADFDTREEARGEFERLKAQIVEREEVFRVMDELGYATNVLPVAFEAHVRAGEFSALLVAADYQDEAGEGDKALLLRAAYHRATKAGEVQVKASKAVTVTYLYGGFMPLGAAVVTPGESVRTVAIVRKHLGREVVVREFKVGDMAEYGSYNLSYYGPIKSITAKTVTVLEYADGAKTRRLKIADFVARNHDFDLAAARKRNAEYMD